MKNIETKITMMQNVTNQNVKNVPDAGKTDMTNPLWKFSSLPKKSKLRTKIENTKRFGSLVRVP